MPFITKLDYSDNRQIKQHVKTQTLLSGATSFGVPFNTLTHGPNLLTSGVSQTIVGVVSTFSGNSGTTNYSWYDSRMQLGSSVLSALTPSNSALTQNTGQIYTSSSTSIIDGNTVVLAYTGVSFDIRDISMISLGSGSYSGSVTSNVSFLSANTLDFTGRTIWVDVSGITRTQQLIITDNAVPGYVWTCLDSEGNGFWDPVSAATSGVTIWTAGTGIHSAVLAYNDGNGNGDHSVSEGYKTRAMGEASHAEGQQTLASGNTSHAEGFDTTALGFYSHAQGLSTTASGDMADAQGDTTIASGNDSHAEGVFTTASGLASHVQGEGGKAIGGWSHAEGYYTTASGDTTHAEGDSTKAGGYASHAEGESTTTIGEASHTEGTNTLAQGLASHAEGHSTIAQGNYSHAEGQQTSAAFAAHSEGSSTTAFGLGSHAEGVSTTSNGYGSHSEGNFTIATGITAHAEGAATTAGGDYSHAEGQSTTASGSTSHASGLSTKALGVQSHTEGQSTTALGTNSRASGLLTIASGTTSFVHGSGSTAGGTSTIVLGDNITGTTSNTVFVSALNIKNVGSTLSQSNLGVDSLGNVVSGTSALDVFTTGFTFNNGTYDLKIFRNDNVSLTTNLGLLVSGVAITGGTYNPSSGVVTFRNSTGGTFSVSGFTSGLTDTRISSYTYNNANKFTIVDTTGGTFSATINVMTGLTVNGGLTATTISATTYLNTPYWTSGLSGSFSIKAKNDSGLESLGNYALAEGYNTKGYGNYSHAEGYGTIAYTDASHAEGNSTSASGSSAHAEGYSTFASGDYSHAEGHSTNAGVVGIASGIASHSEGEDTLAIGNYSHAEGRRTTASGDSSHSEGSSTVALLDNSHSEGNSTTAAGFNSHAEGLNTTASGISSHAEGSGAIASGAISHAEGNSTASANKAHAEGATTTASGSSSHAEGTSTVAGGNSAHAEGNSTTASGTYSHAEGNTTIASGNYSHAEGGFTTANGSQYSHAEGTNTISSGSSAHSEGTDTIAGGANSHAEGGFTISLGSYSHAEGLQTTSVGHHSHSEGASTTSFGVDSHAEGNSTIASGTTAHAEGKSTTAFGNNSHAEGQSTTASGINSHTEGSGSTASGLASHAEGQRTIASGINSHAEGSGTTASGDYSHAGGSGSIANGSTSFIHSVNSNVSGDRSAIIGGQNITGTTSDTVYVPNLIVYTGTSVGSRIGLNTLIPQYTLDLFGSGSRVYFNNLTSTSKNLSLSGDSSAITTISSVSNNTGVSMGMRGTTEVLFPGYGSQNDAFIYAGLGTNGLNIIKAYSTGSHPDYIRLYAGAINDAAATTPDVHVDGNGFAIGLTGATQQLDVALNARFRNIGSSSSAGALYYTSNGTLTKNTSDARLKTNIVTINNALDKVKALRGVYFNWNETPDDNKRIGLIAQEVNSIVPELTFTNVNSEEHYMGVHYDNITALLIEAVKELSSGVTNSSNTYLETQTILAEDNDIQLNYSGTSQTAIGGGIVVLHAIGQDKAAEMITDENGDWITNNDFKPNSLTIPYYSPSSSNDENGNIGNITRNDNYLFIKTTNGWKRTSLENF